MAQTTETYRWSHSRPFCEDCQQSLFITRFAHANGQELLGGGYPLLGALIQVHIDSGHVAFTAQDLIAHGVPAPD